MRVSSLHYRLLILVPGKDDDTSRLMFCQHGFDEALAKGARATGNQYAMIIKQLLVPFFRIQR